MSNMQFLPELQEFLKTNGHIYTVRGYGMTHKSVWVDNVGWCTRIPQGLLQSLSDLEPLVADSGFDSLRSWVGKIRHFIRVGNPAWLYKVVVER